MTALDRIISIIAIALMLAFFGIIAWKVRTVDLTVVLLIVSGMVVYDFYFRRARA